MRLLQLLEATSNSTWYHGTPELQKISEFEGRTLSVDYLTDPEKWMAIQDQMQKVESGSDEYMDLIHAAGNLRQHKNVRSPVFLSNQYPIAKTYADDRRAFDYQAAVPGVIPVEVAPGNTLTINGRGQSFRGITIDSVRQGLSQAGIDEPTINREIAQFTHQLRGDGDKLSTNSLAAIVDELGFDIIDVTNIKDNYMGGGPPATVRMVMNPSLISIKERVPGMAESFIRLIEGKPMVGYKVMNYDPRTGTLTSGRDARQKFPLKKGYTMNMPGNGIYMSLGKDYVVTYYSGLAENEVLIEFSFDPDDILFGNLTDRETEFAVSKATINDYEVLESDEEFDEGMDSGNFLSKDLSSGPTIYPVPQNSREYENIDSPRRGGAKVRVHGNKNS